MFDNVGEKLKSWAKVVFAVGLIVCIIGCVFATMTASANPDPGLVLVVLKYCGYGGLCCVASLFIYGFGEIVCNNEAQINEREKNKHSEKSSNITNKNNFSGQYALRISGVKSNNDTIVHRLDYVCISEVGHYLHKDISAAKKFATAEEAYHAFVNIIDKEIFFKRKLDELSDVIVEIGRVSPDSNSFVSVQKVTYPEVAHM